MDIIKIHDSRYETYEKLLFERDTCRKEAEKWRMNYVQTFGEMINKVFEKQVECIVLKQKIAFCQQAANKGEPVKLDELKEFTEKVRREYNEQLKKMVKEYETIKDGKPVSEEEVIQIKKTYHKIARMIHPDINPETDDNPLFKDLWQRVVTAYTYNQLDEIQELEVIINSALAQTGAETAEILLPDINEKIEKLEAEIEKITSTDPYRYKFLLEDEYMVKEKFTELDREYREYLNYESELQKILKTFVVNGVSI